ncbi:YcnI family copper-binding membrane protein [Parasphingorhabdus pacifica]
MRTHRIPTRAITFTTALGLLALAGAGTASAHVSANPEEAPKGGHAKIAFRVPNERPDANTVEVTVKLPLDQPLSSVRTAQMPGWDSTVNKVELEEPVDVAGAQVTEAVASITWTAEPGAGIAPDRFAEFEASLGTLPTDTDQLVLPTEQTYDNGEVVKWDQPPTDHGEPESPAPTLALVEEEGGHSHGGSDTAPAPDGSGQSDQTGQSGDSEPAAATDNTARWLGGAGLLVGALGLGIGGGALLRSRNAGNRDESGRNEGDEKGPE